MQTGDRAGDQSQDAVQTEYQAQVLQTKSLRPKAEEELFDLEEQLGATVVEKVTGRKEGRWGSVVTARSLSTQSLRLISTLCPNLQIFCYASRKEILYEVGPHPSLPPGGSGSAV